MRNSLPSSTYSFRQSIAFTIGLLLFGSTFFISGCSGSHGSHAHSHPSEPVFKGKVAKVEFQLTRGVTVITDSEGKQTTLEGFPSVPCSEIEIFQHGHEYEVYTIKQG